MVAMIWTREVADVGVGGEAEVEAMGVADEVVVVAGVQVEGGVADEEVAAAGVDAHVI